MTVDRAKRAMFVLVFAAVLVSGGAVAGAASSGSARTAAFPDVPDDAFYSGAVQWAKDNGITTGVGDTGLFQPDSDVTRGEMATFLLRLHDLLVASITASTQQLEAAIELRAAQLEAAIEASAAQLAASIELEAAEAAAASLPRGAIEMNAPTSGAVAYAFSPATTWDTWGAYIRLTSSGQILIPLPGPESIGGVDYVPASVEYCHDDSAGGLMTLATVYGTVGSGWDVAGDSTATVTAAGGCRTIDFTRTVANPELVLTYSVAGMELEQVTTTWVPASDFAPAPLLSPADSDSAPANG